MKRRIIMALLSCIVLAVCWLLADFHSYTKGAKNIACRDSGLIFSITTYDGKQENRIFVKNFGHSWLSLDNRTGHSVFLNDYEILDGETLTFSVWAISGHCGVVYNLEPSYIENCGRYVGRQSLSINIEEDRLAVISEYIEKHQRWTAAGNCSRWSLRLWNLVTGEECALQTQMLMYTPKRLQNSLQEYCGVETDRDFSAAEGIFVYENGLRKELKLCQ